MTHDYVQIGLSRSIFFWPSIWLLGIHRATKMTVDQHLEGGLVGYDHGYRSYRSYRSYRYLRS